MLGRSPETSSEGLGAGSGAVSTSQSEMSGEGETPNKVKPLVTAKAVLEELAAPDTPDCLSEQRIAV